jgi:hypothetical protein
MDGVWDQNPSFFSPNLNRCYKIKRDLELNRRTCAHTHTHTHTHKVQVQFDSQLQHVSLLCFFEQEKRNTIQSLTIFVYIGWDSDNQFGPLHFPQIALLQDQWRRATPEGWKWSSHCDELWWVIGKKKDKTLCDFVRFWITTGWLLLELQVIQRKTIIKMHVERCY